MSADMPAQMRQMRVPSHTAINCHAVSSRTGVKSKTIPRPPSTSATISQFFHAARDLATNVGSPLYGS